MRTIVLASTSPRRKEILSKTGLPFFVVDSQYEEDMTQALQPHDLAKQLANGKARAVAGKYADAIIIAADTFIVHKNMLLGKPKTKEKAKTMLRQISGTTHQVITGVTILDTKTNQTVMFSDETIVHVKPLTDEMITQYIASGEPLDKAGAYAIQGLGAVLIEKIAGDFFTVMGLPLSKVADHLIAFGINVLDAGKRTA